MLSIGPNTRIFVGLEPVDMRGSFDALAGQVRRLGEDPLDGHLYRGPSAEHGGAHRSSR